MILAVSDCDDINDLKTKVQFLNEHRRWKNQDGNIVFRIDISMNGRSNNTLEVKDVDKIEKKSYFGATKPRKNRKLHKKFDPAKLKANLKFYSVKSWENTKGNVKVTVRQIVFV